MSVIGPRWWLVKLVQITLWPIRLRSQYLSQRELCLSRNDPSILYFSVIGDAITDFIITLTDIPAPATSPRNFDHQGYRFCGQYPGEPPPTSQVTVTCNDTAIGTYLYIYTSRASHMHFAEVEVFGSRRWYLIWLKIWMTSSETDHC